MIVDGKFIECDSVIDDAMLPEHLRTESYITHDLQDRSKVMVLRELNFTTTRVNHEGVKVSFPVMLAAGELIPSEEIPDSWQENKGFAECPSDHRSRTG